MRSWLVVALLGCASAPADDIDRARAPILNGVRDEVRTGVVAVELAAGDASELCTGFLITADLVLTARHCVSPILDPNGGCSAARSAAPHAAAAVTVIPDTEITMNPTRWAVAEVLVLPDSEGRPICGADLALLRLATPTNPVGAIPLRLDAPPAIGEAFVGVGYGATAGGADTTSGTRRAREGLSVESVGASMRTVDGEWIASEGPCVGDSGSPALAGGAAIGVMSRGSRTTCRSMIYERLDTHASWLRAAARASAARLSVPAPGWAFATASDEPAPAASPVDGGCTVGTPGAYDAPMTRLGLFLVALLALGCSKAKAKVGDKCDNGARACIDAQSGLYCAAGAYQPDTCKGPKGCVEDKGQATCDITGNNDGDPCPAALDGFSVCRADRKTRAMCKGGKYVVEACKGEDGCTTEQVGMAKCDKGNPDPGETCTADPRLQFCAAGKKAAMTCKDGKYVVVQNCPGTQGCREQTGGAVACDPGGAFAAGDPCFFISAACTADGKSLLTCKDGKFAVDSDCPGEGKCSGVACDKGFALEKDVCTEGGRKACSQDKKSMLECKTPAKTDEDSTWKSIKKCAKGCEPKDGKIGCE